MKKKISWLRLLFHRPKRVKQGDVIIDYDGITYLEYEVYRVDPILGVAFARGVWEGNSYEKLFSLYYDNPRHIFDYPYEPNNPDPPRRFLLSRK